MPTSGQTQQTLRKLGRSRPRLAGIRPKPAEVCDNFDTQIGKIGPEPIKFGPGFPDIQPNLPNFDQTPPGIDQPGIDQLWPVSDQIRPEIYRC